MTMAESSERHRVELRNIPPYDIVWSVKGKQREFTRFPCANGSIGVRVRRKSDQGECVRQDVKARLEGCMCVPED